MTLSYAILNIRKVQDTLEIKNDSICVSCVYHAAKLINFNV